MFGNFNDPFFRDVNNPIAEMHNSMMRNFMDPFGMSSRRLALQGPQNRSNQQQLARREDMIFNDPFSLMNSMMTNMSNMNSLFVNMDNMMQNASRDPNAQVFSSSTVMSYSNAGNGEQPKIYQATTQTKQLPGGIKETKRAVRDSEKGIEKMSVGHHIGDKAHIVERQRARDGQYEEVVNLENLDDNEVNEFDREFENKIRQNYNKFSIDHHHHHHNLHRSHHNQPLAIDDGRRRDKKKSKSKH